MEHFSVAIGAAAGQADDHLAMDDHHAAGLVVALAADRDVPDDLAGARIQRDQMGIRGCYEDLVPVERDAAIAAVEMGDRGPMRFSQISLPVLASSACTILSVLEGT